MESVSYGHLLGAVHAGRARQRLRARMGGTRDGLGSGSSGCACTPEASRRTGPGPAFASSDEASTGSGSSGGGTDHSARRNSAADSTYVSETIGSTTILVRAATIHRSQKYQTASPIEMLCRPPVLSLRMLASTSSRPNSASASTPPIHGGCHLRSQG